MKSSWSWVETLLHSIHDQPDAAAVHAQFDRVIDAFTGQLPAVTKHLEQARADILAAAFRKRSDARSSPTAGTRSLRPTR